MENINEEQLNLIARHLRGETSAFEENLLQEWLNENDLNKKAYQETVFLWKAGKTPASHVPDVESAWEKVKARTLTVGKQSSRGGKVRPLFDAWTFMKVAAGLLLFIGLGYWFQTVFSGEGNRVVLSSGDQKKEFFLPDSSKVWLNTNTTLSYTESYNENSRNVYLEGEAFFEVRKDKEKPFIVNGILSRTEVLGTSFSVRSFKNETSDEVKVVTGKVSFSSKDKGKKEKVFLLAGDQAYLQEQGKIEKSKIESPNFLAWKSDKLLFDNTSLKEVVSAMENYFKVSIEIKDDSLSNCRFTGTFTSPDIEEMMKVLSVSINLSYSKNDKAYLLTGKGCE